MLVGVKRVSIVLYVYEIIYAFSLTCFYIKTGGNSLFRLLLLLYVRKF